MRRVRTSSDSSTSAPMESCQSAPAFACSTMPCAWPLVERISPSMTSPSPSTLACTTPTRLPVRFSWLVRSGTDSGISIPVRSTTTGWRQPGSVILPPE